MGLFSKRKEAVPIHQHPAVHQHLVAQSFTHVRKDVQNLYEWIRYLHQQNKAQQDLITHMSRQLQAHATHGMAMDEKALAHIQELRSKIVDIDQRLGTLQSSEPKSEATHAVMDRMSQIVERLESRSQAPQAPISSLSSLQEKVAKKVQQNSKEYIKAAIRSLVQKYAKISGLQLRETIVDEQGLCSRSSFYRLLSEIETEGSVQVSPSGKEKVYAIAQDVVLPQIRNL